MSREKGFHTPFEAAAKALKKKLEADAQAQRAEAAKQAERAKEAARRPPPPKPGADEEIDFAAHMEGIARLDADPRGRPTRPLPPPNARHVRIQSEESEVLAELAELIDGRGTFDIEDTDEFLEGCVTGLDRRILRALKRGDYSIGAHLDLHGLTRDEARKEVARFVTEARRRQLRCVLIVHGRGHNSKDQLPVLKLALRDWLERGHLSGHVLAFATARPHDGGAGAMYLLLRK